MSTIVYATCARRPRNLSCLLASSNDYDHSNSPSTFTLTYSSSRDSSAYSNYLQSSSSSSTSNRYQNVQNNQSKETNTTSTSSSSGSIATAGIRTVSDIMRSNSLKYLIAGALSGIVSRTAVSPLEVVATINMCTAGAKPPPIIHQLKNLFVKEGVRGFFKGNAANCLKVAPSKGIQFVSFEAFKRLIHKLRQKRRPHIDETIPLSPIERFLAGGLAGIVAATICYPLDTAKTLLTTHPEKFRGVFSTMSYISKQQGPKSLYRGLSPTLVAMMPYAGLDFAIYEQLKLIYYKKKGKEPDLVSLLFIGAFAGAVAQTACHPLDVLRKRLQLQGIGGRPIQYKSMFDAANGIIKSEGLGSLFRGLQPMYISAIPSAGVSYVVYEFVKRSLGVRSFQ